MACGCGMMKGKCIVCKITWILIVIGGLNWGLIGIGYFMSTNLNLVNLIFGNWPWLEAVIYVIVGLATLMKLFGRCKCGSGTCMAEGMKCEGKKCEGGKCEGKKCSGMPMGGDMKK